MRIFKLTIIRQNQKKILIKVRWFFWSRIEYREFWSEENSDWLNNLSPDATDQERYTTIKFITTLCKSVH